MMMMILGTGILPPITTPGVVDPRVTQGNIQSTICVSGYTSRVRPPVAYTNYIKMKMMKMMGLVDPSKFELDHRIPLEVGGHPTDPGNLWPEPYEGLFNAHDKDELEDLIHKEVCAGRLTLEQGQSVFKDDWTTSWNEYVMINRIKPRNP